MIDRDYALKRLKSRTMTKEEFNYDILTAPPILSMFTAEDIDQLYRLATSAKYSAKLDLKYKEIDRIMKNRGFEKLVSGTNRVAYAPTFADNFIVKVAYDTVAINDSIREYRNQFFIKPFCTKVFEVSPNGVLGVFEKVNPITSRKEYISLAADIYALLSDYIIGEYIIDDIGTEYFNNIGFRYGFGAVVLDFPYVYKVDHKKIWCNKPDYRDPTGYCNGPIDYDLGFNKLVCKKCGAVYKPFELAAKKMEYIPLVQMKEREEFNMKISVSGGTFGLKKQEIETGDFMNPVNAIKSNILNKKVDKKLEEEKKASEVKTVNGVPEPKAEKVEDEKIDEAIEEVKKDDKKEAVSPIAFDESLIGKKGDPGYADKKKDIGELLAAINNLYYYSDNTDDQKEKIVKETCDMLESLFLDNIEIVMKMFANILRKKKNLKDEVVSEFLEKSSCSINNQFIKLLLSSDNYNIISEVNKCTVDDDDNVVFNIGTSIYKVNSDKAKNKFNLVYSADDISANLEKEILLDSIGGEPEAEDDSEFYESGEADGFDLANAVILTKKDLFPGEDKGKVMVVKNDDGSYLTLNNKILAINNIDDRDINNVAIVAKKWYDSALKKIELLKEAPVGSLVVPISEEVEEEASG